MEPVGLIRRYPLAGQTEPERLETFQRRELSPPILHCESCLDWILERAVFVTDSEFEVEMLDLAWYAPVVQPSFEGHLAEFQTGDGVGQGGHEV